MPAAEAEGLSFEMVVEENSGSESFEAFRSTRLHAGLAFMSFLIIDVRGSLSLQVLYSADQL